MNAHWKQMWHVINLIWYGNVNNPLKLRSKHFLEMDIASGTLLDFFMLQVMELNMTTFYYKMELLWHRNMSRNCKPNQNRVRESFLSPLFCTWFDMRLLYSKLSCSVSIDMSLGSMHLPIDQCLISSSFKCCLNSSWTFFP